MNSNRIKGMVSVVMPTYNRSTWIKNRLGELCRQPYKNIEVIIINDGSTDNTEEVIGWHKDLLDIKLINLPKNSGTVSIPRAIGIIASRGEFISPADDDVEIENDKFQVLVDAMEDDVVLTYGDRRHYWSDSKQTFNWKPIKNWEPDQPYGWGVDNGQFIYRSDVYEKIPIRFPKRACDWELAKQIKPLGRFVYVPKFVSCYIHHTENRSLDENTKTRPIHPEEYSNYFKEHPEFKVEYNS